MDRDLWAKYEEAVDKHMMKVCGGRLVDQNEL